MTTASTRGRLRRRAPTRRALLLLALGAGIGGCLGSEDWTDIDFSGGVPSCNYILGSGSSPAFTYVCPPTAADAGSPIAMAAAAPVDGGPYAQTLPAGNDVTCVLGGSTDDIPTVAVGATFAIAYDGAPSSDASARSIAATPAVDSLVHETGEGWIINEPEYVGFVATQGTEIAAFTHVLAREATWISLISYELTGGSPLGSAMDAATTFDATVNVPAKILATLRAANNGPFLSGAVDCTFVSGDAAHLAIVPEGIVAEVVPLAPGDVTFTATCLGLSATATIHVTGGASADAGEAEDANDAGDSNDASAPQDASDAANVEDSP